MTVWNRTRERPAPLVEQGARLATSPHDVWEPRPGVHLDRMAEDDFMALVPRLRREAGLGG